MELRHRSLRGGRLSTVLKEEMKMSTGLMNRLKWQDLLFVNGVPRHTDFAVQPGDLITVPLDEPEPDYPAEDGELTILYEDDHILAVDKPAGMLIHPSHSQFSGTLANRVLAILAVPGSPAPSIPCPGGTGTPLASCCWAKIPTSTVCCRSATWSRPTTPWSWAVPRPTRAPSTPPSPVGLCPAF